MEVRNHMATKLTLDNIRAQADEQYASLDIEVDGEELTLPNVLRHSKDRRNRIIALQKDLDSLQNAKTEDGEKKEQDVDELEGLIDQLLVAIADSDEAGEKLVAALTGLPEKMVVVSAYGETTQVGEASTSQD